MVEAMATASKATLRKKLLAARRSVADDARAREAQALNDHLNDHLGDVLSSGSTVCAHVPVDAEPGSIEMLDVLLRRAGRVLVPVAHTAGDGTSLPLVWGEYRPGRLVTGRFGLLEPRKPWLPATVLVQASVVIVPALAVDRIGERLGRGRGFYDRSLVFRDPQARLVALVRDEELVDELPAEPHDVRMTHALTPGRGVICFDTAAKSRRPDGGPST
jgi:5-formyltetrahydrofolate cyclo-ligase